MLLRRTCLLLFLFVNQLLYGQISGLGVEADIGSSYTDFSELNNFMSSSGIDRLDEFSYHRSLGVLFLLNGLSAKGGFSLSEYVKERTGNQHQSLNYTNWQLYSTVSKSIIQSKRIWSTIGLGVAFSKSEFNYFSGGAANPFLTGHSNTYFSMLRKNSFGLRAELNFLVNVYRSRNEKNQIMLGLNSAYSFFPANNDWVNIAGQKIVNVPEIRDNNVALNLTVVYVHTGKEQNLYNKNGTR